MEDTSVSQAEAGRVAYVLKMYPRFSETFIVNELLAHQAAGVPVDIVSLRPPLDGRFHESLAAVDAPATYLPHSGFSARSVWEALRDVANHLPDAPSVTDSVIGELLGADGEDAMQAIALAELVRTRGVTHLHAHFGSVATTVARLAGLLTGVPYTFTAHAKDIFHDSVKSEDLRTKLSDAAAVVTVSDFNLTHLRAAFGPAADRVVRVYNGLDLAAFPYQPPVQRPPLIVAVGRLIEKKGFIDLIRACGLLDSRGVAFRCQIVGTGPEEATLRAEIEALGLSASVELLGARPQGQVKRLVQAGAVFAAPCVVGADGNRDGLPTVLLEAMALGTPCVASDVTGIPEVLLDGRTGLHAAQHDPAELADALERLLTDPELRVRLAGRARRMIEEQFDVAHQAAQVRALFSGAGRQRSSSNGAGPRLASSGVGA